MSQYDYIITYFELEVKEFRKNHNFAVSNQDSESILQNSNQQSVINKNREHRKPAESAEIYTETPKQKHSFLQKNGGQDSDKSDVDKRGSIDGFRLFKIRGRQEEHSDM